jgi:hypothetical protein
MNKTIQRRKSAANRRRRRRRSTLQQAHGAGENADGAVGGDAAEPMKGHAVLAQGNALGS